ncbi:MAG: hypothetical protein V1738_04475 [Patescibacteria group bacterium]
MVSREEVRIEMVRLLAELNKLEKLEPESDRTLARVFEVLPLIANGKDKQAKLIARASGESEKNLLKWLLGREKPNHDQRCKLIRTVREMIESRL